MSFSREGWEGLAVHDQTSKDEYENVPCNAVVQKKKKKKKLKQKNINTTTLHLYVQVWLKQSCCISLQSHR